MTSRSPLRVLYVFRERKLPLLARWQAGQEPDTLLFGFNHLEGHGIRAGVYEPAYGRMGRALAAQAGRLGPDLLQVRALAQFKRHDAVLLTAGWPLLLLARRFLRRPPKLIWLNLSLSTLLAAGHATGAGATARPGNQAPFTGSASAVARLRAAVLRRALAGADRVVCVSRAQQAWLAANLGLDRRRLPFVPSGVDAGFYTPAIPPRDEGYILAAGRDPGRDYGTLLRSVRGLERPVRLVAGPANLRGLALDGLDGRVVVQYNLPPAALREAYRGASCVVVPTHGDGYPRGSDCSGTLVLLDALATAKPAVITERASVWDYVSPGREALTVRPGDPDALFAAIRRALDAPDHAAAMAAAGRQAVHERYNTRRFAAGLADVFREAVG